MKRKAYEQDGLWPVVKVEEFPELEEKQLLSTPVYDSHAIINPPEDLAKILASINSKWRVWLLPSGICIIFDENKRLVHKLSHPSFNLGEAVFCAIKKDLQTHKFQLYSCRKGTFSSKNLCAILHMKRDVCSDKSFQFEQHAKKAHSLIELEQLLKNSLETPSIKSFCSFVQCLDTTWVLASPEFPDYQSLHRMDDQTYRKWSSRSAVIVAGTDDEHWRVIADVCEKNRKERRVLVVVEDQEALVKVLPISITAGNVGLDHWHACAESKSFVCILRRKDVGSKKINSGRHVDLIVVADGHTVLGSTRFALNVFEQNVITTTSIVSVHIKSIRSFCKISGLSLWQTAFPDLARFSFVNYFSSHVIIFKNGEINRIPQRLRKHPRQRQRLQSSQISQSDQFSSERTETDEDHEAKQQVKAETNEEVKVTCKKHHLEDASLSQIPTPQPTNQTSQQFKQSSLNKPSSQLNQLSTQLSTQQHVSPTHYSLSRISLTESKMQAPGVCKVMVMENYSFPDVHYTSSTEDIRKHAQTNECFSLEFYRKIMAM